MIFKGNKWRCKSDEEGNGLKILHNCSKLVKKKMNLLFLWEEIPFCHIWNIFAYILRKISELKRVRDWLICTHNAVVPIHSPWVVSSTLDACFIRNFCLLSLFCSSFISFIFILNWKKIYFWKFKFPDETELLISSSLCKLLFMIMYIFSWYLILGKVLEMVPHPI